MPACIPELKSAWAGLIVLIPERRQLNSLKFILLIYRWGMPKNILLPPIMPILGQSWNAIPGPAIRMPARITLCPWLGGSFRRESKEIRHGSGGYDGQASATDMPGKLCSRTRPKSGPGSARIRVGPGPGTQP